MPFLRRPFPLRLDLPQRQVDQLDGGLVVREVALIPDRLSHLTVQALDGVSGVDDLSDLGGESEERNDLLPLPTPAGHSRGTAVPQESHAGGCAPKGENYIDDVGVLRLFYR